MKYLKTYNQINEGLRDMMKPKSDEDILKDLKKLPISDWIYKVKKYNMGEEFMPSKEEIINYTKDKSPSNKLINGIIYNIYELVEMSIEEGVEISPKRIDDAIKSKNVDILNLLIKDLNALHKIINIIKLNKIYYEFLLFLKEDFNFKINPNEHSNFEPGFSDFYNLNEFIVEEFIKNHKEYLSKKHNVTEYSITDKMWDNNIGVIKSRLEEISKNYDIELKESLTFTYGNGNLKVKFKEPKISENDKKIFDLFKDGLNDVDELYDKIIDNL